MIKSFNKIQLKSILKHTKKENKQPLQLKSNSNQNFTDSVISTTCQLKVNLSID